MKKTFLTLLFSVIALVTLAENHGKMTYHNDKFKVNSEYVVDIGKEYIFTVDTLILVKEDSFYGSKAGSNTPVSGYLYTDKSGLFDNEFKKSNTKFFQTHKKYNNLRILSNDTIVIRKENNNDQTIATFRHFAQSDIEALMRICDFSIKCKADTVCVGDSIYVDLVFGNANWVFEGNIIFGKDTLCYKDKKFEGNTFFVAKDSIGATPLTVKGRLTHNKFAFDYEKEIKKIVVKEQEASKSNFTLWIIIGGSVVGALLIAGVIIFIVIRKKKRKKAELAKLQEPAKQDETENGNSGNANNGDAPLQQANIGILNQTISSLQDKVFGLEKENARMRREHEKEVEKLKREKEATEGKVRTIADERDRFHQRRYDDLQTAKLQVQKNLEDVTAKYRNKISENEGLQADIKDKMSIIANKDKEIGNLNAEMQNYRERVDFVPYAVNYGRIVKNAIEIASQVSRAAADLLEKPGIDDVWHIVKAISKYNTAMLDIDLEQFYTEVQMINNGQIVLKGTMISKFNTESSKDELDYSIKSYFFNSYLKRYMDALIVFNESMAGIDRLTAGVSSADVARFNELRTKIENVLKELGITANYVKLFDNVGEKIDLQAEVGDYGDFFSGTILEVENCIIYLTGGNRPETKIKVKIQE